MKRYNIKVPVLDYAGKATGETYMKNFTEEELKETDIEDNQP